MEKTIARIFEGFQWKIVVPGVDWQKVIGNDMLGASFGLVIRNVLDIDISEWCE